MVNKSIKEYRITKDLISNYISLIFLGISGIGLNLIVGRYYGSSTLGLFNQVLSIYIVFPMIGSAGIQYSVLYLLPKYDRNSKVINSIVTGSLIPTILISLITSIIFYYLAEPISRLLGSEEIIYGLRMVIPGIFFFSVNKVLIYGVLNGLREMVKLAFYQSIRYVLILISLIIATIISLKGLYLPVVFSFSETILFILLIFDISRLVRIFEFDRSFYWAKKHISYSSRAVFNGILVEINSRVDILMIGYYLSDNDVGIYTMAALFSEGFLQLMVVVQNNVNPVISSLFARNQFEKLSFSIAKVKKLTYRYSFIIGLISIMFYLPIIKLLLGSDSFDLSFLPFIILITGICIASGYIPFNNILSMANFPGLNTIYMLSFVIFNIIANVVLIPIMGINGAALGTGISFIFSAFMLSYMVEKYLKFRI